MSSQTIHDAFAPAEAKYKEQVMQDTWGHLAPEENTEYTGWIVFCWASDGDLTPIDYDFKGLDGSPWLYDAIIDFIEKKAKSQGKIYRWDGTFKNYKFTGKVRKLATK